MNPYLLWSSQILSSQPTVPVKSVVDQERAERQLAELFLKKEEPLQDPGQYLSDFELNYPAQKKFREYIESKIAQHGNGTAKGGTYISPHTVKRKSSV